MKKTTNKAYTLVELIVVITILAILGTIAFISLQGYSKTARDSKRVSDIGNIKTSLELFILNTGSYPFPDVVGSGAVYYSGDLLWTQGTVGNNVYTNLSKNFQNKPLDPLFEIEYTYSIANTKKEYQVMALYEREVLITNNIINNTYAANAYNIKVEGTYNEVFIKTPNYIVPVPSIIISEETPFDLITDAEKIKSMVLTNGTNFPNLNIPNTVVTTGALDNFVLSATGIINKNSSDAEKISVINTIKSVYENEPKLAILSIYDNIIKTTNSVLLADQLILHSYDSQPDAPENSCDDATKQTDNGYNISFTIGTPTSQNQAYLKDVDNCGYTCIGGYTGDDCEIAPILSKTVADCTTSGVVIYGTEDGLFDGTDPLTCADDIIMCSGIATGYTLAACNVGATVVYTNQTFSSATATRNSTVNTWAGGLYQWGNNAENSYTTTSGTQIGDTIGYSPSTYSNPIFITMTVSPYDWTSIQNDNLWGNTTDTPFGTNITARQGPCTSGYHVPLMSEWTSIISLGSGWSANGTLMSNALKLPFSGMRLYSNGNMNNQNVAAFYWSSELGTGTATAIKTLRSNKDNNIMPPFNYLRAGGFAIRCFKN